VTAPARFVDLDGRVVAEIEEGELAAALDAFAHDVFVLDLGANRYVMTRTEDLSPLLALPHAQLAVEHTPRSSLLLGNVGVVAALGVVLEDARPYDAPGWVTFSDNVVDLLPGETREIDLGGPVGELIVEGWNARA
jgi:beta-mannosidase